VTGVVMISSFCPVNVYLFLYNLFNGDFSITETTYIALSGRMMSDEFERIWEEFLVDYYLGIWRYRGKPRKTQSG
jgi:hypothetical protein